MKQGWYHGKKSRGYMDSPLTINEILATGKGIPDISVKGALRFDILGTYRESKEVWVHPKKKIIYHFLFNIKK
ncbi:MAG: hypothetical protein ACX93T_01915 [Bacteroidota bacterium]